MVRMSEVFDSVIATAVCHSAPFFRLSPHRFVGHPGLSLGRGLCYPAAKTGYFWCVLFQSAKSSLAAEDSRHLFIPALLQTELHRRYNASQMQALNDCLKLQGITLIQGPPGTGKTTTIMAVLSVVLNAQMEEKGVPSVVENSGSTEASAGKASEPVRGADSSKRTDEEPEDKTDSSGDKVSADEIKERLFLAHPWLSQRKREENFWQGFM